MSTPNLGLTEVAASQAQKHVTVNTCLRVLDALLSNRSFRVTDRDLTAPPGSPSDGATYLVASSPTGAWSGQAGKIAYYNTNAWVFYTLRESDLLYVLDEDAWFQYTGSVLATFPANLQNLSLVGVNTSADSTNKLSVASDAVLFNHNGTDSKVKVNKNATGNTASHLFQKGFSGRAEFGLIGNDSFTLKSSADGSTWADSLVIDTAGIVDVKQGMKFATGNTLSRHLETSFTPALNFGGLTTGITYSSRSGLAAIIGNMMHFVCKITLSSKGSATGSATITGLPYSPTTSTQLGIAIAVQSSGMSSISGPIICQVTTSNTLNLVSQGGTSTAFLTDANFGNSSILTISGSCILS